MAWGNSFDKLAADTAAITKALDEAFERPGKIFVELKPNVFSRDGYEWSKPNAEADAKLLHDVLTQDGAIGWPNSKDLRDMPSLNSTRNIGKIYNNTMPTHDPYTNPDAHIYYECNCGQILDPGTKRFAELNNCASRAGWKIRFSDSGYIPYCVECGKGVE